MSRVHLHSERQCERHRCKHWRQHAEQARPVVEAQVLESSQFGGVVELGISSAKFDFLVRFRSVVSFLVSSSELKLSSGVFGWPLDGRENSGPTLGANVRFSA